MDNQQFYHPTSSWRYSHDVVGGNTDNTYRSSSTSGGETSAATQYAQQAQQPQQASTPAASPPLDFAMYLYHNPMQVPPNAAIGGLPDHTHAGQKFGAVAPHTYAGGGWPFANVSPEPPATPNYPLVGTSGAPTEQWAPPLDPGLQAQHGASPPQHPSEDEQALDWSALLPWADFLTSYAPAPQTSAAPSGVQYPAQLVDTLPSHVSFAPDLPALRPFPPAPAPPVHSSGPLSVSWSALASPPAEPPKKRARSSAGLIQVSAAACERALEEVQADTGGGGICPICLDFKHSQVRRHIRCHGPAVLVCRADGCWEAFRREDLRKRHERTVHRQRYH